MADLNVSKDVNTNVDIINSTFSEIKENKADEENLDQSINTISSTPSDIVNMLLHNSLFNKI